VAGSHLGHHLLVMDFHLGFELFHDGSRLSIICSFFFF
jgi:hypothetical protein